MESCGWPGNEATVLCITIKVWKGPTNRAVHVHVCDVGVGGKGVCVCVKGGDPHHSLPCRLCELE